MQKIVWCLLLLVGQTALAQEGLSSFAGGWKGELADADALQFSVTIQRENHTYHLSITNQKGTLLAGSTEKVDGDIIHIPLSDLQSFQGKLNADGDVVYGFVRSSLMQYHIQFQQVNGVATGTWLPWHVPELLPPTIYAAVEVDDEGNFAIYPFFDDARFPGTFAANFVQTGNTVDFVDFMSGMGFRATFSDDKMALWLTLGGREMATAQLSRYDGNFPLGHKYAAPAATYQVPTAKDWPVADAQQQGFEIAHLQRIIQNVNRDTLTKTDAVLIARDGKLVFEIYFNGFDQSTPHQLRSAQKSFSSALVGIAIGQGLLKDTNEKLVDHLPEPYRAIVQQDKAKSAITMQHLLTMSSGLDAVDFGIDRFSPAAEDNYQPTPDWTKTILEAPMIHEPGSIANYGSANPHLVGAMLEDAVPDNLTFFQHEYLLQPLGIDNYAVFTEPSGSLYLAGGMFLRPQDMLKFGQLYLDKGKWHGQQILPEAWVERSLQNYLSLQNANDKNGYGYFWWHKTYKVNGKTIHAIEARGAGGQYISLVPKFDLVVAITSGNFRNGRFWQPELIMEHYILPAIKP